MDKVAENINSIVVYRTSQSWHLYFLKYTSTTHQLPSQKKYLATQMTVLMCQYTGFRSSEGVFSSDPEKVDEVFTN